MAKRKATLPSLDHLTYEDYDQVYEPSEDTFLLCDALRDEQQYLRSSKPLLALEIGPGSGTVCTYLSCLLAGRSPNYDAATGPPLHVLALACDVNVRACEATLATVAANEGGACPSEGQKAAPLRLDAVQCDLVHPLLMRLAGEGSPSASCLSADSQSPAASTTTDGSRQHTPAGGSVDVLLFNPPYVPTPDEEVPAPYAAGSSATGPVTGAPAGGGGGTNGAHDDDHTGPGIEAAWAGGTDGRLVIDRFILLVPRLLTMPERLVQALKSDHSCGLEAAPACLSHASPTDATTAADSTGSTDSTGGAAYILLVQENDPKGVGLALEAAGRGHIARLAQSSAAVTTGSGQASHEAPSTSQHEATATAVGRWGLSSSIIRSVRARNELLHVLKVTWKEVDR